MLVNAFLSTIFNEAQTFFNYCLQKYSSNKTQELESGDACFGVDMLRLCSLSCNGSNKTCTETSTIVVGRQSCNGGLITDGAGDLSGRGTCFNVTGKLHGGSSACNGRSTCHNVNGDINLGRYSCLGLSSCEDVSGDIQAEGPVACIGNDACELAASLALKSHACIGDDSCSLAKHLSVGHYACMTKNGCKEIGDDADIGDFSCIGQRP